MGVVTVVAGLNMTPEETQAADLIDIALACCTAHAHQEAPLLTRAWQAIQDLPPAIVKSLLPDLPDRLQFEHLMAAGANESAAMRLTGSKLGYMTSRSPDGIHLTTIIGPGIEELALAGETFVLSLCAALLTALGTKTVAGFQVARSALARLN